VATIACEARGTGVGSGNAYWWFEEEGQPKVGLTAYGSAQGTGHALFGRRRGVSAAGAAGAAGVAQLFDPRGSGASASAGVAHLSATYAMLATGCAGSSGRIWTKTPGSYSVIWIMKVRE
jgi:hypothetical protein